MMDPLSDVLSLLRPRSYMAGGFDLGGEWSIQFQQHQGIKCYALVTGHCWLAVEGIEEPIRLSAGDCFLLPRGLPFRLATDLSLPAVDPHTVFPLPPNGRIVTWKGGGCLSVGGFFAFDGAQAHLLLAELPPVVHIRSESGKADLLWLIARMRQELREQQPGSSLVAGQLATMMLVQALRMHLADSPKSRTGWLSALTDAQLRAGVLAMHEAPAYPWSLQMLAGRCGMSRSVFALKFKTTVGLSPMEYLTRWRMLLAEDRLVRSTESVSAIARFTGYESESAFSKAFRRVMGLSPRELRAKCLATQNSGLETGMGAEEPEEKRDPAYS